MLTWTIRTRMYALAVAMAIGVAVFSVALLLLLRHVRVGGPVYLAIIEGANLVADTVPPPLALTDAYLNCTQAVSADTPEKLTKLISEGSTISELYRQRLAFWSTTLGDGEVKRLLLTEIDAPAQEFFKVRDDKYLPAVKKQDWEAASQLMFGTLTDLYVKQRTGVDKLVEELSAANTQREQSAANLSRWSERSTIVLGSLLILLLGSFSILLARSIGRRLAGTVEVLDAMAAGDTSRRLPETGHDEIAHLSRSVNRTVDSLAGVVAGIIAKSQELADAGERLSMASELLGDQAGRTRSGSGAASEDADQVSQRVGEVAASTEEMRATIGEIAGRITQLATMVDDTTHKAESTKELMAKLDASSLDIAKVAALIGRLADQTNLLALNASIEGAGAGTAGRGFLVVAEEVKALAQRSASASTEVAGQVKRIRQDAQAAGDAIASIRTTVIKVNELQQEVAAAMTESAATTDEIAGRIQDVADRSRTIASTVRGVNGTASETTAAADEVRGAASDIKAIASALVRIASGGKDAA